MAHRWHFFRAGGVDQVALRDADDILALHQLDQKLWVALAMPVKGIDIDEKTLELIDADRDGRIRVVDVLEMVDWLAATFKNVGDILTPTHELKLTQLKDEKVVVAAKHLLEDLGKPDEPIVTIADALEIVKVFSDTVLNGDGIVIPESTDSEELKTAIVDAVATIGHADDRSGKPGIDKTRADEFFAEIDKRAAWITAGKATVLAPLGDKTAAAHDAFIAVRAKLDDYFTRARIANFDARGTAALGGQDAELTALSGKMLSAGDEDLAKLPLARIDPSARLGLESGVNPAWAARLAQFSQDAVLPILGARPVLAAADIATIADRLDAYTTWRATEPKTKVDTLDAAWVVKLSTSDLRTQLADVIAKDAALAPQYDGITSVIRAVRLQRDGVRILRNFVNFSDFYSRKDGAFQAGTLYIDSRAMHLTVTVDDASKHGALAASADSYLAYVELTRNGEKRQIAAAVTNGTSDNIFVGRNGIFYDRANLDWDATVTKIIANPISIREAFWSPYKKLVRAIEDNVTRRAAAADQQATGKLEAAGKDVAHVDKAALPVAAPPKPTPPPPKKIDLGTVAAIGVAVGGIGTLVGALLGSLFGLGKWLPIGIVAIFLLISGPSMLLAWLKLRRRNLGPILDANGWAINGRARVNVAFGAAMTEVAKLPKHATRSLADPFADKRTPWKRWVLLALLIVLAASWYVGKLDRFLPTRVKSTSVLGKDAPAYVLEAPVVLVPATAPVPTLPVQ